MSNISNMLRTIVLLAALSLAALTMACEGGDADGATCDGNKACSMCSYVCTPTSSLKRSGCTNQAWDECDCQDIADYECDWLGVASFTCK